MKTQPCERCPKPSKVHLAYGPHWYCADHFNRFFEERIKRTIRTNRLFKPRDKLLIAVSGGKDSMTLLHVLAKEYAKTNELHALIIDEGIKEYREKAIQIATDYCKKIQVPFTVVSHKEEFGFTNDEYAPLILDETLPGKGACGYCGTFRKTIMNRYAKKLGATVLATGHNLDDEAQNVLMNVFDNHLDKMMSLSPRADTIDNKLVVPRIKPLYETPEKDIVAYANLNHIPHYAEECCPYSFAAKRNDFRLLLNQFETNYPGTKFSLLRFLQDLKANAKPMHKSHELKTCEHCGEIAVEKKCQACQKKELIQQTLKSHSTKTLTRKNPKNRSCNQTKRM